MGVSDVRNPRWIGATVSSLTFPRWGFARACLVVSLLAVVAIAVPRSASAQLAPSATISTSCLGGNGTIAFQLSGGTGGTDFVYRVSGLEERTQSVPEGATEIVRRTGRRNGVAYAASVLVDGVIVASESMRIDCGPTPAAVITVGGFCVGRDGRIRVEITNTTTAALTYEVGLVDAEVDPFSGSIGAGESVVHTRSGRTDRVHEALVTVSDETLTWPVEIACDDPAALGAIIESYCEDSGGVVLFRLRAGSEPVEFTVSVSGLDDRVVVAQRYSSITTVRTGRPDGNYDASVRVGDQVLASANVAVDCIPEPAVAAEVSADCVDGGGRIAISVRNGSEATVEFAASVRGVDAGPLMGQVAPGGEQTVYRTGRSDGEWIVDVTVDGGEAETFRTTVDCVAGDDDEADPLVVVGVAPQCDEADGSLVVEITGGASAAEFTVSVTGLDDQLMNVAAAEQVRLEVPGLVDGTYQVTVTSAGAVLSDQTVVVTCDVGANDVGFFVDVACVGGAGVFTITLVNTSEVPVDYLVTTVGAQVAPFTGVLGAGATEMFRRTGRNDGRHVVAATIAGVERELAVVVRCTGQPDSPAPGTPAPTPMPTPNAPTPTPIPAGPEADIDVYVECPSIAEGVVFASIENTGVGTRRYGLSVFELNINSGEVRFVDLAPGEAGVLRIGGLTPAVYTISVSVDGVTLDREDRSIQCTATPTPSPPTPVPPTPVATPVPTAAPIAPTPTPRAGPQAIDTIVFPAQPVALEFPAQSDAFDGVSLTVKTTGGLYPWDVQVRQAYTTPVMGELMVSELVDLHMDADAPAFDEATLVMAYDPDQLSTVAEADLRIHTYDEETQFWLPVSGPQVVDTDANTITATLDHFSIYGIPEIGAPSDWQRVLGDTPVQCVSVNNDLGVSVAFAIDTSGSMRSNDPGRLRVDAAKIFVDEMRERDEVAVASFSSSARTRIARTQLVDADARAAVDAAIDLTGGAGGGTNISRAVERVTSLLSGVEPGRPRIGLLLTDGSGSYSTSVSEAAAAANVTIYTVGLGSGANETILAEIADITGGQYIPLTSADQLVPLYEQLGGTIFDDNADADLDTISNCVETNGAFVPAVVTRAWTFRGFHWTTTTNNSSFVVLNPDDPDTDGDTVNDGVELQEADLRDDPDLASYYSFLVDAGVTRYYKEISDPLDPLDPSSNVGQGDLADLIRIGLLDVAGLDIDDTTLFQPDRYPERPVIGGRLLGDRTAAGVEVSSITYDDPPVVYASNEDCVVNCAAVRARADERKGDGLFGCSKFGNDLECEIREVISEARDDQAIFADNDYLSDYFIREQLALQCAIVTRDLDTCVIGAFNLYFDKVEPYEIDELVNGLTADKARLLLQVDMIRLIAENYSIIPVMEGGKMTSFLKWRESLVHIFAAFDRIDAATGAADGYVSPSDLFDVAPGLAGNSAELNEALAWVDANRDRFDTAHAYFGIDNPARRDALRDEMLRTEAYRLDPAAPLQVLRAFPLVGQGEMGIDLRLFQNYDTQVRDIVDRAIANTDPGQRILHNEIVSRMPETWSAIRNDLITAMYIEYGQAVHRWLGPDKGGNWGLIAPWASQAINGPIKGQFPAILPGPRQAAGDGNQWIFNNIGSRYAAFVEMIEADPTPSVFRWEQFFADNFSEGDQAIRDGFVALAAAFYEDDLDRAQVLLFQSNALLATHEQAGAQLHLEEFDIAIANDNISTWFVDLDMGVGRRLQVDQDLDDNLGIDLEGPAPAGNRMWDEVMLALDPTGQDASTIFDVAGRFDVAVGAGQTGGVVDVASLGGVGPTTPPSWTGWRNGADVGAGPYSGSGAGVWWDWDERMWYLLNLFRVLHADAAVALPPPDRSLASGNVAPFYGATTLSLLDIG